RMTTVQRVWEQGERSPPRSPAKKESGMPWHKVVILHNDQARWAAAAVMGPFIMGYHEHGSTPPENAVVYHGLNDTGDHVYYFSPEASIISIATKAFHTFRSEERRVG